MRFLHYPCLIDNVLSLLISYVPLSSMWHCSGFDWAIMMFSKFLEPMSFPISTVHSFSLFFPPFCFLLAKTIPAKYSKNHLLQFVFLISSVIPFSCVQHTSSLLAWRWSSPYSSLFAVPCFPPESVLVLVQTSGKSLAPFSFLCCHFSSLWWLDVGVLV